MVKFFRTVIGKLTRKANDRLRALAKKLGNNSPVLENIYSKLDKVIPPENLRFNKNGVLQIVAPKKLENAGVSAEQLQEVIDSVPTFTELKKRHGNEEKFKLSKKQGYQGTFADFLNGVADMFNNLPALYSKSKEILENSDREENEQIYIDAVDKFNNAIHAPQDLASAFMSANIILNY